MCQRLFTHFCYCCNTIIFWAGPSGFASWFWIQMVPGCSSSPWERRQEGNLNCSSKRWVRQRGGVSNCRSPEAVGTWPCRQLPRLPSVTLVYWGGAGTGGSRGGNSSSWAPLSLCKTEMGQIYHKTQSNLDCLEQWGSLSLNRGHLTKLGDFSRFHKGGDWGGGGEGVCHWHPRSGAQGCC